MTSMQRVAGPVLGLALTLVATPPASAGTTSTWELRDIGQRTCVSSTHGHPGAYFLAPVFGDWPTTITTGIRNLPAGSTSAGGSVIPPGSNHGNTVIGFVQLSIAPVAVGVYKPEVWASDGTETKTVPVTITVQERC